MKQYLKNLWQRLIEAQARRAQARALRHLDGRALRDIGLESWNSDLARRLEAARRQDMLAWRADLSFGGLR